MVRVPLEIADVIESARMVGFHGLCDGREHVAILFGEPTERPTPLVRVHSECLTSEVFGSMRCDCGPQLRKVRLLSPAKAAQLGELGVTIRERLPTSVYGNQPNLGYLKAKVRHVGHVMNLDGSGS